MLTGSTLDFRRAAVGSTLEFERELAGSTLDFRRPLPGSTLEFAEMVELPVPIGAGGGRGEDSLIACLGLLW